MDAAANPDTAVAALPSVEQLQLRAIKYLAEKTIGQPEDAEWDIAVSPMDGHAYLYIRVPLLTPEEIVFARTMNAQQIPVGNPGISINLGDGAST